MFTGLVESVGTLISFNATPAGRTLQLSAPAIASQLALGESLAVNGCCLTVTGTEGDTVRFDLLAETLNRTNLGRLTPGSRVNLERALAASARLGGHFVQGHVDRTTHVAQLNHRGADLGITIDLPADFARYVIPQGSIAINGVSLTVAELREADLTVWIIPHTLQETNLGNLSVGDPVNVEFDVLAKYAARQLENLSPARSARD